MIRLFNHMDFFKIDVRAHLFAPLRAGSERGSGGAGALRVRFACPVCVEGFAGWGGFAQRGFGQS